MTAELESAHEDEFQRLVRLHGGMVTKIVPVQAGWPDRLVIGKRGDIWFVELKAVRGRVSAIQRHCHEKLRRRGHVVVVLWGSRQINDWVSEELG